MFSKACTANKVAGFHFLQGDIPAAAGICCIGAAGRKTAAGSRVHRAGQFAAHDLGGKLFGLQAGDGHSIQQTLGIGVERILEQILGLGIFHTLAQIHDHDLVADVLDHAQIVGDKDIGQLFLILQIHQQIQDLCLNGNVQCRDRLVADDELRVHGQCAANADALAAAAVQLVAETLCITLIQTNGLHDLGDAGIVFVTVFAGYNCNVYIGHEGIEGCLAEGADVVITGRAADSALFLTPLKYEFGWAADDWDNLARGIMAGHLLECGGQGAGGNYMYDWRNVPRMDELGFPIAELTDDTFEITKAPDCGGIICEQSCKEQFLYEVHDPANYLTPDVNVDISHATITQVGDNRVRIGGVKGKPRPDTLKLCVGYHKGWKTVSMLSFAWPDAYEKAQYCAEVIMKKMQRRGMKADDIHISYIGLNSLHLGVADMSEEALKNLNECVLRIAVFSEDKSECAKIIPEISPLQLNGPPGASFFGGRARVQEVMALWPTTVPRDAVQVESHILEVK